MKAKFIYSHLNGLEWLQVHHPKLWAEVKATIKAIDANKCKVKVSEEKTMKGRILYSPGDLNKEFKLEFEKRKWQSININYFVTDDTDLTRDMVNKDAESQRDLIIKNNKIPIHSNHQIDFVKDRVAVEVQFGKYAFIEFDLFVKHLGFFNRNEIDLGIEIIPTKLMQGQMSSGPGYYERTLTHILRHGRGTPSVPLVLIGVE